MCISSRGLLLHELLLLHGLLDADVLLRVLLRGAPERPVADAEPDAPGETVRPGVLGRHLMIILLKDVSSTS